MVRIQWNCYYLYKLIEVNILKKSKKNVYERSVEVMYGLLLRVQIYMSKNFIVFNVKML